MATEGQNLGMPDARPSCLVINKLTKEQLQNHWDLATGQLSDELFMTVDDAEAGSMTIQYMGQAAYNRLKDQGGLFDWQYYATPALGDDPADLDELMKDYVQKIKEEIRSENNEFTGSLQVNDLDSYDQTDVTPEELSDAQFFVKVDDKLRKVGYETLYNSIVNRMYAEGWFNRGGGAIEPGEVIGQSMSLAQCVSELGQYGFPAVAVSTPTAESNMLRYINASSSQMQMYSDKLRIMETQVQWTVSGVEEPGLVLQYAPSENVIDYTSSNNIGTFKSGSKLATRLAEWWQTRGGGSDYSRTGAWHGNTCVYNHSSKSALVKVLIGVEHSVEIYDAGSWKPLEQYRIEKLMGYPVVKNGDRLRIKAKILATSSVPHKSIWYSAWATADQIEQSMKDNKSTTADGWKRFTSGNMNAAAQNLLTNNSLPAALASSSVLKSKTGTFFTLSVWKAKTA